MNVLSYGINVPNDGCAGGSKCESARWLSAKSTSGGVAVVILAADLGGEVGRPLDETHPVHRQRGQIVIRGVRRVNDSRPEANSVTANPMLSGKANPFPM